MARKMIDGTQTLMETGTYTFVLHIIFYLLVLPMYM